MKMLRTRHLAVGAFMATTALTTPAHAQYSPPDDVPEVRATRDQFGVNLVSRKLDSQYYGIATIGQGGPGSLSYIWATSNAQSTDANASLSISGSKFTVVLAGSTRTFTLGGGVYDNDQGTGETLAYDVGTDRYSFTRRDGSVLLFGKVGTTYVPLSLTYPAGEVLSWNRDAGGTFRSWTTNLGYQMRRVLDAQGYWTKIVLFDMADETCSPTATSCTLVGNWPTIDFTAGTVNGLDVPSWTSNGTNGLKVTFPTGRTLVYERDSSDRVTSVTDGKGTWTYSWPSQHGGATLIYRSDRPTHPRAVTWDTVTGRILGDNDTSPDGADQTSYAYDTKQRLVSVTRNGIAANYTYDSRGNITQTKIVSRTPGTPADIITSSDYPTACANPKTCNLPISTTDARGNITNYSYDTNHGGLLTLTAPAPTTGAVRPQIRFGYTTVQANYRNGSGTIIQGGPVWRRTSTSQCATQAGGNCNGTADEVKSTIVYGSNDALAPISQTSGSGNGALAATSSFSYTNWGDVKTVDGPLAGTADTSRFYYDAMRRTAGMIGPDPDGTGALKRRAERITYNGEGQVLQSAAGTAAGQGDNDLANMTVLQQVVTAYNAQGLPSKEGLDANGSTHAVTQFSYTPSRMLECTAVRMNPAVFSTLPQSACSLGAQGSFGPDRITKISYTGLNEPSQVSMAFGTPEEAVESTVTWANGVPATQKDGENNLTTYEYDGFNRLVKTRFPVTNPQGANASSTTDYEQVWYDANSNATQRRVRSGATIGFTYDALNRLTDKDSPTLEDVDYTYDLLGRPLSVKFVSSGQGITTSYDALSQPISSTTNVGGTARALSYQYDLAGDPTRLTWWDGVYVDYDRLVTGELSKVRLNGATSGSGVLATFGYNDFGARTSLTRGNGVVTTYTYDAVPRLTSLSHNLAGTSYDVTIGSMNYNPASEIVSQSRTNDAYAWTGHYNVNRGYTTNGLNQYTAAGPASLTYNDGNGNLTGDGTTTFTYDIENKLTNVSRTGLSASLSYDPLDRLDLYNPGAAKRFIYDGEEVVAELDGTGAIARRFIRGDAADEVLLEFAGSGTTIPRYPHLDERGSDIAWSDSSGAMAAISSYDEYGIPASGNPGRFQYTGQMWLPDIGVYNYKARMYSPTLGRFLQTDPIGYADGMNIHAYVGNDPVNGWDPTGLSGEDIVVTGRREGSNEEERRRQEQAMRDSLIAGLRSAGEFGITLLPGYDAYQCLRNGCTFAEGLWAAGDFFPGGKLVKLGGKVVYRGVGVARRMAKACGCLEAGTLVATPNGLVPIETLKVGDLVMAMNEDTGEVAAKPVTALIRPEPKPLYEVSLRDASGEIEAFHATDDHPWKVEGKGWVETANLESDDRVDTASGADMVVLSMEITDRVEPTYNLEVADWHTFLIGEDQAVVHNGSLCSRAAALAAKLGRNHVFIRGAGGKVYKYDLAGKAHYDKATGSWVQTPHMKVGQVHTGSNGRSSVVWGETRSMTEADFRTVQNYLGR